MLTNSSNRFVVRRADRNDLARWQAFVDRTPEAGCMHHAAWYDVLCDTFWVEPHFLIATDSQAQVQGILPLYRSESPFTGPHISSLEEGILSTHPEAATALLAAALELRSRVGARYLQIRGSTGAGVVSRVVRTIHTMIPTAQPEEALWSAVKKKTRWGIRQGMKQPIAVDYDPELAELQDFYRVYAEHMRALGTPVIGFDVFDSIRTRLGPDRLRLYIVRYRAHVIGGMLCILNCGRWTDQYALVRPSEGAEFANYLLYWHVIRDACIRNVPRFDLGRSTPNSNVHLFKRKWGGVDIDMPYHFYSANVNQELHLGLEERKSKRSLAQRVWSHLPLALCNRVGPLLRKQLPFI